MKTSNKNVRHLVENCEVFTGSHLFSEFTNKGAYVVYSYGHHFPIYAFINGLWHENKDKYSVSTSKHQSQAKPHDVNGGMILINTEELQNLIRGN